MLFGVYAGKSNVVMETDVRAWRDIEITLSSTSSLANKPVVNGMLGHGETLKSHCLLLPRWRTNLLLTEFLMPLKYATFPLSLYWHILTTFNLLYFMPHLFNVKLHPTHLLSLFTVLKFSFRCLQISQISLLTSDVLFRGL